MTAASGGTATAAGLGFQYLATVDALLDCVESGHEDFTVTTEDPGGEILDFSVRVDDVLVLAAQVKASIDGADGDVLGPTEILRIAKRLVEHNSSEYLIATNRQLTVPAQRLLQKISEGASDDINEYLCHLKDGLTKPAKNVLDSFSANELRSLTRLKVRVTELSMEDYAQHLVTRITTLRRRTAKGIGQSTGQVLLYFIVAEILYRSARRGRRSLDRPTAHSLLGISDKILSYATDHIDWGQRIGAFPTLPVVSRPDYLERIASTIGRLDKQSAQVPVVLLGMSGIGKSSLASAYAEQHCTRYDVMMWIDSSSNESLRASLTSQLGTVSPTESTAEMAVRFRQMIDESPRTWLLIFDNAPSSHALNEWLPVRRRCDIIATSTNALAWNGWRTIDVEELTTSQSIELVVERFNLSNPTEYDRHNASNLARTLGNWPLAIDLACAFLTQSGRGLNFTSDYLQKLSSHVIDDIEAMPAGYRSHPTLLQAILVALDDVRARDEKSATVPGTALLNVLAYLPPESAPIQLAELVAAARTAESKHDYSLIPTNNEELALLCDDSLRNLRAASLVHLHKDDPLACRTNEVILDVVRQLHEPDEARLTLGSLQELAHGRLLRALDNENFVDLAALFPIGMHIAEHSNSMGAFKAYGTILLGNMSSVLQLRRDYESARRLLDMEIELASGAGILSDALSVKIHTAIAYSELHLHASFDSLSQNINSALEAASKAIRRDPKNAAALHLSALQLLEIFGALDRSPLTSDKLVVSDWRSRTRALFPKIAPDRRTEEFRNDLDTPCNADLHTAQKIAKSAEEAPTELERIDLMWLFAVGGEGERRVAGVERLVVLL